MAKKIFAIAFLALYLLPAGALAASPLSPYWGPIVSCVGAKTTGSNLPVCSSFCDVLATGQNVLKMGITLALYIIAPIFFVWGGVLIMLAGGDPGKVKDARKMLLAVAIGVAIVLVAFVAVDSFFTFFAKLPSSWPGSRPGFQPQVSWSEIKCNVEPQAPPVSEGGGGAAACSSYTSQSACDGAANCGWNGNACAEAIASCSSQTTQTACENYSGCSWAGGACKDSAGGF